MRTGDGIRGLTHVVRRVVDRQRPALREHDRQIASLEQLHHHERRAALERAHVVHAHDVIRDQRGSGAAFAQKAFARFIEARVVFRDREHLDRDALTEIDVRRREHHAHAARAYDRCDAILLRDHVADGGDLGSSIELRGVYVLAHLGFTLSDSAMDSEKYPGIGARDMASSRSSVVHWPL
jgi:hypothetical protein